MFDQRAMQASGELKGVSGEEVAATFISMLQVPPSPSLPAPLPSPAWHNPDLSGIVQDAGEVTGDKCGDIKRLSAVYDGSGGGVSSLNPNPTLPHPCHPCHPKPQTTTTPNPKSHIPTTPELRPRITPPQC